MATFSVSWSIGETTARMTARLSDGDADFQGTRYARLSFQGGGSVTLSDDSGGASSSFSYTVQNLVPGGTYFWTVELGYKGNAQSSITWLSSLTKTGSFTTDLPQILIDKWSWTSSNGTASASQTRSAYNAAIGRGTTTNFSYLVWNDMVDKVIEIMSAAGITWSDRFASLNRTKVSSGDKDITAVRFNSLRYNIGIHVSTGIDTVSKGDPILGSYFITLADRINQWIDRL